MQKVNSKHVFHNKSYPQQEQAYHRVNVTDAFLQAKEFGDLIHLYEGFKEQGVRNTFTHLMILLCLLLSNLTSYMHFFVDKL